MDFADFTYVSQADCNCFDRSSILTRGTFAFSISSADKVTSGNSYFRHRYSFSNVVSFICGHSLQAELLSGGAGMKTFCGEAFCIWCMIPGSVATINSLAGDLAVYASNAEVEPIKSALSRIVSSHSGCAINNALGCRSFRPVIFLSENISCTIQVPSQSTISLPVSLAMYLPRFLSGPK